MSFQNTFLKENDLGSASERALIQGRSTDARPNLGGDHQNLSAPASSNAPISGSARRDGFQPPFSSGHLGALHLLGPVSLTDAQGTVLTPRGKKAQAILGLLALAPRGQRTRAWLRDKLWSDSNEKRSSSSLRQSLFEIKRDIGPMADHILAIDRHTIGLRLDRLWIDVREIGEAPHLMTALGLTPDIELLEGMDVSDPEFEDWLMMERQIWFERAEDLAAKALAEPAVVPAQPTAPVKVIEPQPSYSLGFLPSIYNGCQRETMFLADYIVEAVAENLHEFQPLSICDFRNATRSTPNYDGAGDTDFYIRARALQVGSSLTLTLFLYRASDINMEWSQSIQAQVAEVIAPDGMILNGFVSQNVDRIAKSIFEDGTAPSELESLHRAGYSALNLMFRLDEADFSTAATILAHPVLHQQNSIYPALQSYLTSFNIGENLGAVDQARTEAADKLLTGAVDDNPFNAVALACLGHVSGYVFKEHEVAESLLDRAVSLNKSQAFVWDHYALHKIYTGQYDKALIAAKNAAYLGAYSPISYSYDITLAMAATMVGDHGQAIARCKTALRKQPRSAAAMRYLLVNYAQQGRHTDALAIFQRLLDVDPEFSNPDVQAERFRLADRDMQTTFLSTIKKLPNL